MISIITPVYNAESFISEAIESVISQSFTDWELILIDDGSTDKSGIICDRYADKDPRIMVLHRDNAGQSRARNLGLEKAKGDFLTFLDADDILAPDALQNFIDSSAIHNADIVCGKTIKFSGKIPPLKDIDNKIIKHYSPVEAVETVLYQKELDNSVWGKMFRRELWSDLHFLEGHYYEDLDIFYKVFLKAKKIILIPDIVYYYRQHSASYIHTFNMRRRDMLMVTERLTDYMKQNALTLLPAARSRSLSANFNMLMLLYANDDKIDYADKEEALKTLDNCWKKIKELRRESLFNPKVRIKNKIGIVLSYIGGKSILRLLSLFTYK